MNWRKTTFGAFLVAMVLSLQLIAAPQAMAISTNNTSVTFRRAVVAWYDDSGRLQMNVTWVNKVVNLTNLTKGCPFNKSNVTPKLNVSVVTLYNMSEKHEQLLFFRLDFYNSTFNYTMYALVYRAERSQYNFTLVTRIFTDPKTGEYKAYLTGMNIIPKDENRSVPVADSIIVKSNLTLSGYYWTLSRVLMKLRKHDETRWIWGKSAHELRHLSHLVKLKLPGYNQEEAMGMSVSMDFSWGCISSIISCLGSIAGLGFGALGTCPLCAQVVTCIPACATIFTAWTCLLCLGTGAAGCFACAATLLGIASCAAAASCL
ncbi:hypothetical protein [Thermococcus sp.]|uniref:hypothetical protein n=1 Tax=Thermococcus sp. TaxID=35749 RepID=UPI0025F97706|nr:hypothetical protein [Thermococcus sp.]